MQKITWDIRPATDGSRTSSCDLIDAVPAAAAAGTWITQLRSVGKCDRQELATSLSVLERTDDHLDVHAGCEGLGNPALPNQASGRAKLDCPFRRLTFGIGNHQENPAMGIRPVEFLDRALQGHRLRSVEHGKGMMRDSRDRIDGNGDARKAEYFEFHRRLHAFSGPLCF